MKLKRALGLPAAVMAFAAVSASANGDITNNIGITNSYTGGDVTIIVYTEGDYQNIINNILLKDSIINGNVRIQLITGDIPYFNSDPWEQIVEEEDFRGEFAPGLF